MLGEYLGAYVSIVFPLISSLGAYLILNLLSLSFIRGQRLKKGASFLE